MVIKKRGPESMKAIELGPLLAFVGWSKDKNDRLWGHTENDAQCGMLVTRHLISIHTVSAKSKAGEYLGRYWQAYIGPLYISWSFKWRAWWRLYIKPRLP